MARKPKDVSIYRIAEEAGVSVPTVSRVINRKPGIAEATRKRVDELLKSYNFKTNYPRSRTSKIAVVYPWSNFSDYFAKAMKSIYAYAAENELMINLIIAQSCVRESLLEAIRDQQCSGVVALMPEQYRNELSALSDSTLPSILIDSSTEMPNIGFIDNDSYSGSCMAASHLVQLGHRKIGYITYGEMSLNQIKRLKGVENTLKMHGVELQPERIAKLDIKAASKIRGENGYNTMNKLLKQASDITAVMAVDDAMALGALAAITDAGLKVPEDISLIGFDNYPETRFWRPALTTVDHPVEEAGRMAIASIHEALKNNGEWIPPKEILPTSLVVRSSTGPVKI